MSEGEVDSIAIESAAIGRRVNRTFQLPVHYIHYGLDGVIDMMGWEAYDAIL